MTWVLWACAAVAALGALHATVNAALLRRPPAAAGLPHGRVSVLLAVRDEEHRVEPCLRALLAQTARPGMEILVLDDGSTDGTAALVARLLAGQPDARLLSGAPPPPGWLGKPHACQQLADRADPRSGVLVFVDADVVLAPRAVAATLALLDHAGLDLVSPYPRQRADTIGERLVQPLLQWSWLTFLPLRVAERSRRASLSAANGQLLAVRRDAYQRAGGHRAVRDRVLDDLALVRAVKRAGGRGGVVDGTDLATCRMYAGWREVWRGYTKSLWAVPGIAGLAVILAAVYVLPPVAVLAGRSSGEVVAGAAGYLAGVAGRAVAARRTGGPVADAAAHPLSIVAFAALVGGSLVGRWRGSHAWKGRAV